MAISPGNSIPLGWRPAVRGLSLITALILLAVFILGIPIRLTELQRLCTEPECLPLILAPEEVPVLEDIGLSLNSYAYYQIGLEIFLATLLLSLAILIFWLRSDTWMGTLVSLALMWFGTNLLSEGNEALVRTYPGLRPLDEVITTLVGTTFVMLLYLFPSGRFIPSWTRGIFLLSLFPLLVFHVIPHGAQGWFSQWRNSALMVLVIIGLYAQVHRYRRASTPRERQQTKWVVVGLASTVLAVLNWTIFMELFPLQPGQARLYFNILGMGVMSILVTLLPLTMAISILRYRLWDIEVLINRAIVYGLLTATLGLVYFGTVVLLQSAFRGLFGQRSQFAVVLSTLAIAAMFNPLRHRIQLDIDRLFYRRRYDAARALEVFNLAIRDTVELDELNRYLLSTVQETMQPHHVSLWMRDPGLSPAITSVDKLTRETISSESESRPPV